MPISPQLAVSAKPAQPDQSAVVLGTRISKRLHVRRLNVEISGSVIHTAAIYRRGAELMCPHSRFELLEKHLDGPIEMWLELPIGRELSIDISILNVVKTPQLVSIEVEFLQFRHQGELGWDVYMDWITRHS